jgi:hypothetical protein
MHLAWRPPLQKMHVPVRTKVRSYPALRLVTLESPCVEYRFALLYRTTHVCIKTAECQPGICCPVRQHKAPKPGNTANVSFKLSWSVTTLPLLDMCPSRSRQEVKITKRLLSPFSYLLQCSADRRYKSCFCRATYLTRLTTHVQRNVAKTLTQRRRNSGTR